MGTRERHEPGTFSWVELVTSDEDAGKAFYADLLGWEYDGSDMGERGTYWMAHRDGKPVAGLFASTEQGPPHWNSYVTVESADDTAGKAAEAGGQTVLEPFDVFDAGRMAALADPTGAMVCVWEPKDSIGAELVNAPGALTWNDLHTTDVDKAAGFYCDVFGWEVAEVEGAPHERKVIRNGERMNGGMAKLPEEAGDAPPHWLPYFAVDDVEAAMEQARSAGGQVLGGPIDVPTGAIAVLSDPQGAVFAVFAGDLED